MTGRGADEKSFFMRIYGNRLIQTLPGSQIRPTTGKVRQALFNIWQGTILGCHWLDLCAGNGSMGAEALARGAKQVIGMDKSPLACKIIQQNWQKIAQSEQTFQVICGDVIALIPRVKSQKFDRIYLDPPYASGLYDSILTAIAENQLLASDGDIAVEHDPKQWQAGKIRGLKKYREKRYGKTGLTFFQLAEETII